MADAADGGNDWEVVSLTASTYAAAPGPISPPLLLQVDPAATSEQSPPSPPPPHPATFMSQHFNLPAEEAPADLLNRGRQELESTPATLPLDGGLGIHCPEKNSCCEWETSDCNQPTRSSDSVIVWNDTDRKISPSATLDDAGSDRTRSASPPHSHVSAAAAAATDDGIAVGSAAPWMPIAPMVAPRVPCEAWWKKTFSFLRGNARESLTFRFVFVADKLQLRLEFGVDSQKMSCAASETLGQVKVSMLGGSPVEGLAKKLTMMMTKTVW